MSQTPDSAELSGQPVSDEAWVEAHVETLAHVVQLYRELREARAKLDRLEQIARAIYSSAGHSDFGDGRWDMAARMLDIIHG